MVKDTYQGMKVFIEQLSFDVPRGSLPNLYSAFMITILGICSGLDCLGKHTSIVGPIVAQVLGLGLSWLHASLSLYIPST